MTSEQTTGQRLVAPDAIIPADAPPPRADLRPEKSALLKFGIWAQPRVNALVARSSKVGDAPVHDKANWPWVAALEANWRTIREEAYRALGDLSHVPPLAEISPDHRRIAPAGRWRSYFLYGYGYRVDRHCIECPETARIVDAIPGINTALFSILVPQSRIPAHTGVTKAILVSHLGLQVPADAANCYLRVADRRLHWEEGKAFVFDDCYNHEVVNDTDETRIVLLIQFRRPVGLVGKLFGETFLRGVKYSRFVQDARRGVIAWSAKRS